MRILVLTTSTNNTFTVIDSLRYLKSHEIAVFPYDRKFHEQLQLVRQSAPDKVEPILLHQYPPEGTPEREAWLKRCSMDQEMIDAAKALRPDLILYISAWVGDFVPTHETLKALGEVGPVVHLCFDASDPPWWPQMKVFEEKGLFALTVNIDGGNVWPGGNGWFPVPGLDWKMRKGLTVLTPCDPRYFEGVQVPFNVRPYAIGYAGNAGGWIRSHLVGLMQRHKGHIFMWRPRDGNADSYRTYCDFIRHCKVVISVPFTGSNATTHVKGRVVEAGWGGACLMEWKNPATASWFTPRADYWEYESIEECLEMSEFLAGHPKLCEEMARNLHQRVTTEHSPEKIWGAVFEKLMLPASAALDHSQ